MPYIKQEDRKKFEDMFNDPPVTLDAFSYKIETEGELNYVITRLCHNFIKKHGKSYKTLNAVHGVLNCADKELYRKVTGPYEDLKIKENGDVI